MDVPQLIVLLAGSSAVTVVLTKIFEFWTESRQGKVTERRAEVDRAWAAHDKAEAAQLKAETERDRYKAEVDNEARIRRRYAESLSTHRRLMVESGYVEASGLPEHPENTVQK